MCHGQSFEILNKGSGLRPSGFTRQVTSARLAGDVIQVWINSSPSNRCISHFKAQLVQLFFIQHLKCTYWIYFVVTRYGQADIPREVSGHRADRRTHYDVREAYLGKSAAGADHRSARRPLTSLGMSA